MKETRKKLNKIKRDCIQSNGSIFAVVVKPQGDKYAFEGCLGGDAEILSDAILNALVKSGPEYIKCVAVAVARAIEITNTEAQA